MGGRKKNRLPTAYCLLPTAYCPDAGWSSPVARQAHNLKAAGSNPAPATKSPEKGPLKPMGLFCVSSMIDSLEVAL